MADLKSIVANMFRQNQSKQGNDILSNAQKNVTKTSLASRESRRYVKPVAKKKDTGKAFTNEEIYRIMNASRLPIQQQKSYYEINPKLKKKVKERTQVAYESRPALVGALEGLNPISGLNTLQGAVGDIDVSKTTKTAPYIVGNMLGQAGQYLMTGGLAQAGVAGTILKGSTGIGKKLAANAAADIITGVPLNVAESLKTAKTPEEFAKNFAVNTALDVGLGAAIGGAGAAIKALKSKIYTKPIADALEKGGYVKDAQVADAQIKQAVKNVQMRNLEKYKKTGIKTTVSKTVNKKYYPNAISEKVGKVIKPEGRLANTVEPIKPNEYYAIDDRTQKLVIRSTNGFSPTETPNILIKFNAEDNSYTALNLTNGERWLGDTPEVAIKSSVENAWSNPQKLKSEIQKFESGGLSVKKPSSPTKLNETQYKKIEQLQQINRDKGQQFIKNIDGSLSVKYTPKELKRLQSENEYYKTGYVTTMSPSDFLSLTSDARTRSLFKKQMEQYPEVYGSGKLQKGKIDRNFMFLEVDPKTWTITGHEGRHRMMMLKDANVKDVDILLRFPRNMGDTVPFNNVTLNPQMDSYGEKLMGENPVMVSELTPLSKEAPEDAIAKLSAPTFQPKRLGIKELPPTTQQAVKNLTQRKLKAGSTIVQPLQEADMITPKATTKTSKPKKEYPVIDEIANMQYRSKKQLNNISSTFVKPEKETVTKGLGTDVKTIQRSLFNSFAPIENRFRKLADKDLMNRGLNAVEAVRKSEAQIQHMIQKGMLDNSGINVVGDSLTSVKQKIEKIVDADLWNIYYAHLQNVYRPKGQAVFPRVTAKESQGIVNKIEADHPEILDARKIALDWRNQMDAYDVASGNMSLAEKEAYRESNPFYFPIARVQGASTKTPYSKKTAELFKVYKTKGGQQDIQPWHVAQENWIRASVGSSKMNDLGNVMEEVIGKSKKTGEAYSPETYSMNTSVVEEGDKKFLRYLKDGKQVKAEITREEYMGLKDFFNPKTKNKWAKKFGKSSRLFKDLTVNWNPIFPLINGPRDFFDAVLNSKDAVKMLTSYPKAFVAAVNSNSPYNKLYHQAGVQRSQFVDRDLADSKNGWVRNTIGRIEQFNSFVEMLPRMAEFVATIDKTIGGNVTSDKLMDKISKDLLQTAGRNAAEVTLNFDKSGLVGKYMNETLFPFFNPALQGFAKTVNLFTSPAVEKTYKDYAKLLPKLVGWGVLPALANEFFNRNNEAYQKLNARDKNLNYIFMLPNGYAIKIPKGRIQAALSIPAREALDPDKTTPLEIAKSIYGSVGVPNPTSSNIIFPAWGAFVSGKNWMGYDIESQKDAGNAIQERWDSSTSEIGKFLGRFTGDVGLSPKDIDYLIDSYTGFLGDVILPLTTKGYRQGKGNAEDIFGRRFLINPTYQNELASKFYNYMDEAEQIGNDNEATDKDKMYFKFLSRYNDELTDLRKQIEEVQLSNAPNKKEQLDALQEQLNATYDTAINGYENFELFLQDSGADIAFEEAVARNAGGTYKDYAEFFNESKMDYQEAEKAGIPVETYYKAFSEMSTDGNDTISQAEAQAYLDSTDLTTEQKAIMWKQVNSGWKLNPYTGTISATSGGGSKTKSVATAYRNGLATKQVNALKNINIDSPNLSSAEIKAIIKMLSA